MKDDVRSLNMFHQTSTICLVFLKLYLVLFDKAECKSGGGHYSSQRTLGSSSGGFGGGQSQGVGHWGNAWLPSDLNLWYDFGTLDWFVFRK